MSFIFFLSSQSTSGVKGSYQERFFILKTFHLIEYAILFILFYFATKGKTKISFLLTLIYAVSDEIHQTFVPGRIGKPSDILIDLLGTSLGYLSTTQLLRFQRIKQMLLG